MEPFVLQLHLLGLSSFCTWHLFIGFTVTSELPKTYYPTAVKLLISINVATSLSLSLFQLAAPRLFCLFQFKKTGEINHQTNPNDRNITVDVCSNVGFKDGGDGFYYCSLCNSRADDIIETGVDDDDLFDNHDGGIYAASNRHHRSSQVLGPEPISQVKLTQSQHLDSLESFGAVNEDSAGDKEEGPIGPSDFGSYPKTLSYEEYYSEIRLRYVRGFQIMIQLQCKALVEKFNVSPLIVGLVGPIWLRFLAFTRVMADEWANEVIHESESQIQGEADNIHPSAKYDKEPHNILGQRAVTIWYESLSSRIPLYYSVAINFLVCHLAREVVLPTDILKWALEGKLPYFAAFVAIDKQLGPPSTACPISSSRMFRRTQIIPLQKLESLAAFVALKIGLDLPPVNFYGIASRFLNQLSIPVKSILPHACRVYEWSMPPELYISAISSRLPTSVFVMSILIVTIRIIFDLNGFGKWEMSLSSSRNSSSLADENGEGPSHFNNMIDDAEEDLSSHDSEHHGKPSNVLDFKLEAVDLLTILERRYSELRDTCDYSKDLASYLQYCKDVVFDGLESSFEDLEEENIIEDLWDFYQNQKGVEEVDQGMHSSGVSELQKRSKDDIKSILEEKEEFIVSDGNSDTSQDDLQCSMGQKSCSSRWQNSHEGGPLLKSNKDEAIRKLKLDMEENKFCYIPPRQRMKKLEYILYPMKKKEGAYLYAVHADYYILLRACARVAQVDLRTLHSAVLNFERRLKQLEGRIDHCLHVKEPENFCSLSSDEVESGAKDDAMDFSELNL